MFSVPLALGLGEGGEAQAPMARAVIGGLLGSTLITLVFVATICTIFEGRRHRRLAEPAADASARGSASAPAEPDKLPAASRGVLFS